MRVSRFRRCYAKPLWVCPSADERARSGSEETNRRTLQYFEHVAKTYSMLGPQRAQRKSQSGEFRGQPGPVAMLPRPARSPPAAEFFQEKSKFTVRFFGQKAIYRENL